MESLRDSVERSINLKLFKNKKDSSYSHIFNAKIQKINLNEFKNENVKNFDSYRLTAKNAKEAYPIGNRPHKGLYDINSVKFHQNLIKQGKSPLIWMARKNNIYYLLDGGHRIIALNLENKKYVYSYVIEI